MKKLTTKEFIKKADRKHGGKYDYSKTLYRNARVKVKIVCKEHGVFEQSTHNHLNGQGCPKCSYIMRGANKAMSEAEFVEKCILIHGTKYDYSQLNYKRARKKVNVICPEHGKFVQRGTVHLSGGGCLSCWADVAQEKYAKDIDRFIIDAIRVHGNKYDYSGVIYRNNFTKIKIICKKHGQFWQTPKSHIVIKQGCPHCLKKREGEVGIILKQIFSDWKIISNKKIWIKYKHYNHKRYCDFWLEKNNMKIIVEYDGMQHFSPVRFGGISLYRAKKKLKQQQEIDNLDFEFCVENNIILHRIKYNEDKEKSIVELKSRIDKIGCKDAT